MEAITLILDPATAAFYRELARRAGVSLEQALADALFKLAGELSLHALHRAGEKQCNKD